MNSLLKQAVHQHLRRLLVEFENELSPTLNLKTDLGLDSLDLFELGASLERQFKMTLPDAEIKNWHTLSDVYTSLTRQTTKNRSAWWRFSGIFFH